MKTSFKLNNPRMDKKLNNKNIMTLILGIIMLGFKMYCQLNDCKIIKINDVDIVSYLKFNAYFFHLITKKILNRK